MKFFKAERKNSPDEVKGWLRQAGVTEDSLDECMKMVYEDELYLDETMTYQVAVREHVENGFNADMMHLSIKRVDRKPINDWRVMQQIKNAFVGDECEAIEIYPAESRLVDSANQYHLWCFTNPKLRLPVGFWERMVTDKPLGNSEQRPFGVKSENDLVND